MFKNLNNLDETAKENDDIVRSMIQHEDKLIGDRIGWSIGSQAFLIAALRLASQSSTPNNTNDLSNHLIISIPVLGVLISFLTIWGVLRAFDARSKLVEWHEENVKKYLSSSRPSIIGRSIACRGIACFSPNFLLPIILYFFWIFCFSDQGVYFNFLSILTFILTICNIFMFLVKKESNVLCEKKVGDVATLMNKLYELKSLIWNKKSNS